MTAGEVVGVKTYGRVFVGGDVKSMLFGRRVRDCSPLIVSTFGDGSVSWPPNGVPPSSCTWNVIVAVLPDAGAAYTRWPALRSATEMN